nr:MAG TPA: hypothetical protein [Caudoviricetes sp.]
MHARIPHGHSKKYPRRVISFPCQLIYPIANSNCQ